MFRNNVRLAIHLSAMFLCTYYVLAIVHIVEIISHEMVDFALSHLSQVFHNVFLKDIVIFTSFVLYSFLCLLKYLL